MVKINFNISSYSEYKLQILAALTVNLISIAHGAALGWLSPALLILQSPNTPLPSGPLTVEEVSWLGSIYSFGAVSGNFLLGAVANTLGRKKALCLLAFPQLTFWLLVIFGNNIYFLYVARVLAGIAGGGAFVGVPLFIAEIADRRIRGSLGSLLVLSVNVGLVLGFILGAHLSYYLVPSVLIILPTSFLLLMYFFPETPQFLLSTNEEEKAKRSLAFYRNFKTDPSTSEKIEFETFFNEIRNKALESKSDSRLQLSDFCTSEARKGMILGLCLCTLYMLSGCFVMTQYTANIFQETGAHTDPNTSAIIVGVSQLIGTYISTILVDRLGRKVILIGSTACTGFGFLLTGLYVLLHKQIDLYLWSWLPIVSLSFAVFSGSAGLIPVTFVILAEILPSKIRPVGSSICNALLNILGFAMLLTYPLLVLEIHLYGIMFQFGLICILGVAFILFCIPETKGKSI